MSIGKLTALIIAMSTFIVNSVSQGQMLQRKNVLEFGCKGNAMGDDRPCIQTAADALSRSGGGTLVFPEGHTFLIASASRPGYLISWPSNVSLDGTGTIKVGDNIGEYRALLSVTLAKGISFQNVTFDGNAAHNQVNSDPANKNDHISIYISGGDRVKVQHLHFINGNDVQTLAFIRCNSCEISDNSWSDYGVGGSYDHDSSEIYLTGRDGIVEGNVFRAAGVGVRTAIEVHQDHMTVARNTIIGYRTGILLSPNEPTARAAVVDQNTLRSVYRGIWIWADDGDWEGIAITRNDITINRASYWDVTRDESGIALYSGNLHAVKRLEIRGNRIQFRPDALALNDYSAGISLIAPRHTPGISDVLVEDNVIENALGSGILWSVTGTSSGVTIKNNTVSDAGSTKDAKYPAVFRTGILDIANSKFTGCSIKNNVVKDQQPAPTMQFGIYHYGRTDDGAETGLTIEGNTVTYKAGILPSQRYFIARNTAPLFHVEIPIFNRRMPILVNILSQQVPDGSSVEDPVRGTKYASSNLLLPQ